MPKPKNPSAKQREPVSSVIDFLNRVDELKSQSTFKSQSILFRGLASSHYEVISSAERRIQTSKGKRLHKQKEELTDLKLPTEFEAATDLINFIKNPPPSTERRSQTADSVQDYTSNLLNRAKGKRLHKQNGELTDLELLAELQHYGAATCLIDFTKNPLIALWFACRLDEGEEENGKVIAMRTDDFKIVNDKRLKENQVDGFFGKGGLWKWTPWQQNNRVIAQQAVFVFGYEKIKPSDYESIEIAGDKKTDIQDELDEKYGINEEYLFSDLSGFAATNAHDKPYKPEDAESYFHLAVGYQQQGELRQAIGYYDQVIRLNPEYADAYFNRGNTKSDLGKYQEAIKDYDKAIELDPKYADAYFNRGNTKNNLRNPEGAIEDYDKAIESNPEHASAYYNRGRLKSGQAAIKDYDKAIESDPKHAEAYVNRGTVKFHLGKPQDAIRDYGKAIEVNPEDASAYYNRGLVKMTMGEDVVGTKEDFVKAFKLDPSLRDRHKGN